jgi:acyl-ACP thioesterase
MTYADRKIALPEAMEPQKSFPVEVYHLDTNHHVNNGQYVKMAGLYLPKDFEIAQMRAEYKKSAVLGDLICPAVCEENEKVVVSLNDEAGNAFAVVEFLKR